jgi:hypothetical protein
MFDPALPVNNSPNSSAEMRGQLTGLKEEIDGLGQSLASEVGGTARDPVSVPELQITLSDPPTLADVQAVLDRLNELILALHRAP